MEKGSYDDEELLAVEWVMRDFKLTRAARYRPGDVHHLRLVPFEEKTEKEPALRKVKQLDDTEEYMLTPYWVVEMEEKR